MKYFVDPFIILIRCPCVLVYIDNSCLIIQKLKFLQEVYNPSTLLTQDNSSLLNSIRPMLVQCGLGRVGLPCFEIELDLF